MGFCLILTRVACISFHKRCVGKGENDFPNTIVSFLCLNIQSDRVVILSTFSDSNANVVRSSVVVDSLFIVAPDVCASLKFSPCLVNREY